MNSPSWRWAAGLLLPLALAAWLYHPWRALPLDIWDFGEFLPLLQRGRGWLDQYRLLLDYYSIHGRSNSLFYLTFVLEFHWFGTHSLGWQWLRFVWMSIDLALVLALARRLKVRLAPALGAAALFVVSTAAVRGWVQLMAEPQAVAALLLATYLALAYQDGSRWGFRCLGIVALLGMVFATKEVVGTLGLVVVPLAIFWKRPAQWRLTAPRNLTLSAGATAVAIAEIVLLWSIRARPQATGYGMQYGKAPFAPSRLMENMMSILVPVQPTHQWLLLLLYPANLAFLLVLVLAARVAARQEGGMRRIARAAAWALFPVGLGATVYWPWPKFDSFYALPFALGVVLLYAAALQVLAHAGKATRVFAFGASLIILCYGTLAAHRSTETADASLRLNASLVRLVSALGPSDTVVVLSADSGVRELSVQAGDLWRYGLALGDFTEVSGPAFLRLECGAIRALGAESEHRLYVSYSYGCGRFPFRTSSIASHFTWYDWLTLTSRVDSVMIDVAGGPVSRVFAPRSLLR